jgi:uncharacterized protein (TIGR03000 family)
VIYGATTMVASAPAVPAQPVIPANAATIEVTLPSDATLTVDGAATTSTSSVRTFVSPSLTPGKTFSYTMQAKYQYNGQPVTVSKKVIVEAGKTSRINLNGGPTAVASK